MSSNSAVIEKNPSGFKYEWCTMGDLNAFFGLMVDNVTNLVILAGILIGGFNYPQEYVYSKMIPGTALGVFFGDLIYTLMAFSLAKRTGRHVTAMPLGLDTPSTIGIAVSVLGPAYMVTKNPDLTWKIGMATLILIGVIKLVMSFVGPYVQKLVPKAGLLGSIGGIGVALLGVFPLVKIFSVPVVGLVALGIILYSLVARLELPLRAPGVLVSVLLAAILYHVLGPLGFLGVHYTAPVFKLTLSFPWPTLGFLEGMGEAVKYLPLALPFGLLTIVGGINVTESAKCAGDDYDTTGILMTEAFATIIAGFTGGVAQSTPYIGHPAYKSIGARAGYTLATGIFIGLGGMFGYLAWMLQLLPDVCIAPILMFVGLEIASMSYHECPREHAPAVTFAFLPIIAELIRIYVDRVAGEIMVFSSALPPTAAKFAFSAELQNDVNVIMALGHGFILTAMLWGAALALIIDRRLVVAANYFMVCAGFTFFGVIHSVLPSGDMYLPWKLATKMPYNLAAGYVLLALTLYVFSFGARPVENNGH